MRSLILLVLASVACVALSAIVPIEDSTQNLLYQPRFGWAGDCYQKAAYKNDNLPVYCIPGDQTIVNEYSISYFTGKRQRFQAFGARENITSGADTYFLFPELFPALRQPPSNFIFRNASGPGYISTRNDTFTYQFCYYVQVETDAAGNATKMYEFGEYFLSNYSGTFACPSTAEVSAKTLRCGGGVFTYYCELIPYVPPPGDASTAAAVFVSALTIVAFVLASMLF